MDDHQRAVTIGRFAGRWADVITNLGRESSTDLDYTYTGEVIGYGITNFGTVNGVVVLATVDRGLVVLSVATVRRLVDRGPASELIRPPEASTRARADAGLVALPFAGAEPTTRQ